MHINIKNFEEKYMSVNAIDVDFRSYFFLTKSENITLDRITKLTSKLTELSFFKLTPGIGDDGKRLIITHDQLIESINVKRDFNIFFNPTNSKWSNAKFVQIELKFFFSYEGYCVIILDFEDKMTWPGDLNIIFEKLTEFIFKEFDCVYGFQYVGFSIYPMGSAGIVNYMLEKMKSSEGIKFQKVFLPPEAHK